MYYSQLEFWFWLCNILNNVSGHIQILKESYSIQWRQKCVYAILQLYQGHCSLTWDTFTTYCWIEIEWRFLTCDKCTFPISYWKLKFNWATSLDDVTQLDSCLTTPMFLKLLWHGKYKTCPLSTCQKCLFRTICFNVFRVINIQTLQLTWKLTKSSTLNQ